MLDYLADSLLACFLRFNATATRHSIASDGDRAQAAAGPFLEFLTIIVAPLNEFFVRLLPQYGAKPVSAPGVGAPRPAQPGETAEGRT
jgi:hypothetical protein